MRLPTKSAPSGHPEGQNPVFFRAQRLSDPVVVALATDEDLSRIAGSVDCASDMLEFWNLLAIRLPAETAVHAVGWRMLLARPWITSALTRFDRALGAVRTSTGSQYSLGLPGLGKLDPELGGHVVDVLRSWGFKRVRPIAPKARKTCRGRKRIRMRTMPS